MWYKYISVPGAGSQQEVHRDAVMIELCGTQSFHGFFGFYFISCCKQRPMCHNLHSFFQVLMKVLSPLQQLNCFSLWETQGHSSLHLPPPLLIPLWDQHWQHTPHRVHSATQLLKVDKMPVLSSDNNSPWLIFKTLELYNICSLCYKELQKIDILLRTKK